MKKDINLLELFSGIGGFSLGLQRAGFNIKKHQFSEIDKHAIANYKYNFKNAEYVGSVVDVRGERGQADIITFGSPCQDFSLAGKRSGMEGQRSSLILEAIRLISEIRPSVFIWENVKGAFSSNNGADFWAILAAFTNIGGYRLEWQLLNTSWFLPQNRERIYLVGHLAGRSEPGVFPIGEESKNDIETQSPQNQLASTICAGYGKIPTDGFYVKVTPVLTHDRKKKRQNGRRFKEAGDPSFTLSCQDQHGVMIGTNTKEVKLPIYNYKKVNETILKNPNGLKYGVPKAMDFFNKSLHNISPCLQDPCHNQSGLFDGTQIRRLTEIECEKLQGFPSDWSKYGNYDGEVKEISKTQRYKMCGNAVTVDVVEAIAKRLKIQP